MKHLFPLVLALLLCGCAPRNSLVQEPSAIPVLNQPAATPGPRYPASRLEEETAGALQVFPLGQNRIRQLLWANDDLILLCETDVGLRLEAFHAGTGISVPGLQEKSLRRTEKGVSYFDESSNQIVMLDHQLQEQGRIPIPEDLTGMALLSYDCRSVYYCTPTAVRCLDTDSGISRILKESSFPLQNAAGLLLEDTILAVTAADTGSRTKTMYLSTSNGMLCQELEGTPRILTSGTRYCATVSSGASQLFLFGTANSAPETILPETTGTFLFVDSSRAAVNFLYPSDSQTTLEYYCLDSGQRTARLTISQSLWDPQHLTACTDTLWFSAYSPEFDCQALYRWDPGLSPKTDDKVYTAGYYSRSHPDITGLDDCIRNAEELGKTYGIEILVYRDATAIPCGEYILDYAWQTPLLSRELELLEERLARFPAGVLQKLMQTYSGITVCIVGSISDDSRNPVSGFTCMNGYDAYLVLNAGGNTEYALYHELCHLMESVVLTHSTAYDRWNDLNPKGFRYGTFGDGTLWLQPGADAFIDSHSMVLPKEDRGRIFEYAMTAGNAHRFSSPILQSKLRQLCIGLREAFGLDDPDCLLPWEQYLAQPLTLK